VGLDLTTYSWATSGVEIDMVSQAGFGVVTASFPLERLRETADCLGRIRTALAPTSLIVGLEQSNADKLRAKFAAILSEAVARPFNERAATWANSKQEDLLRALLESATAPPPSTQSVSNGERARVLKAALSAIHDQPEDVLTVSDLCRIARASERTLHHAFTERFGLPPAHYMKARRLNGVRNDLCRELEPSMKIADIANKWGFWHLGQFAKDYRSWFRELPSDTFERKHGTNLRRGG
jgi:AraC family transcriptional regulator, ethanolamine operon transcriptional activator